MASLLKNENYTELNTNHMKETNCDWLTNLEARYAVSKMFAGCVVLDETKATIINSGEPYGRKKLIDPHYERYSKKEDLNSSIPDSSYHYRQARVTFFESASSGKLVVGLFSCNLLCRPKFKKPTVVPLADLVQTFRGRFNSVYLREPVRKTPFYVYRHHF